MLPIHLKKASAQIPVIAIAGSVSVNVLLDHGIHNLFSITPRAMPLEEALANVKHNLQACSRNIAALYAMNLKQCTKEK
ncbi:glycerate kinase [Shewanella sp. VB17]|uniref:glycerate kinase n=1 Tax=Shewanella sp. VB17 TaxID=2739432 RepID=UPI0015659ADA|nr:glycerate kinase [Shewanella sp. VB17]NRD74727.1 glycerate kinase [Shewanella sp. VB17]